MASSWLRLHLRVGIFVVREVAQHRVHRVLDAQHLPLRQHAAQPVVGGHPQARDGDLVVVAGKRALLQQGSAWSFASSASPASIRW